MEQLARLRMLQVGSIWLSTSGLLSGQCEQAAFTPPVPVAFDHFGHGVAISGSAALVGCPDHDASGISSGSANVYRRIGRHWQFEQELVASDGDQADYFGFSVALDGDVAVAGAWGDEPIGIDSGSAYVFRRIGGVWVEEAKLVPADGERSENFGYSVAVSGNRIVVGSLFGDDAPASAGALYVYLWNGASWGFEQKLTASDSTTTDYLGNSVSISGERIVSGAHYTSGTLIGSAYVFRRVGGTWVEEQKLLPSDALNNAFFGYSVSVDVDRIVVGAYGDSELGVDAGKVYVYQYNGTWAEEAKLTASNAAAGSEFGRSVGIDGPLIVVGARGHGGQAYSFRNQGGSWTEEFDFTASDVGATSEFGGFIQVSGESVVVGAPQHDIPLNNVGSAYVYIVSDAVAQYANYGTGWPGRLGVPFLTVDQPPFLGAPMDLAVGNSLGALTFGILLIGLSKTSQPTSLGGTLLVLPSFLIPLVIETPYGTLPTEVPCNGLLAGLSIYVQILEVDPIASHGYSFTPGLELKPGF